MNARMLARALPRRSVRSFCKAPKAAAPKAMWAGAALGVGAGALSGVVYCADDDSSSQKMFAGAAVAAGLAFGAYTMSQGDDSTDLGTNSAFVFLKPHACTEEAKALVKKELQARGFRILAEKGIDGTTIDEKMYIDKHYYAIASKATLLQPHELNVPADKFKGQFGLGWQEALDQGLVYNALDACKKLNIEPDELDAMWGQAKKSKNLVKFGGGFYCAFINDIYIFNGFFMSMRSKFTGDAKIHTYVIEWDAKTTPWADFRGKVLGPTDPADAPEGALRALVAKDWKGLGLPGPCNTGDNAVHASASPFEAMAERTNWLESTIEADSFGKALLAAGIPKQTIEAWSVDPVVAYSQGPDGQPAGKFSLFDLLEDLDTAECVAKCQSIFAYKK